MKNLLLVATLASLASCSDSADTGTARLDGVWKSDEKRTLASMDESGRVSNAQRTWLEANFFGNLHVEYRGDEVRAWNKKDGFDLPFKEYEVVEETVGSMKLKVWDESYGGYIHRKIFFDDGCYYLLIENLNFREYFCRVSGES